MGAEGYGPVSWPGRPVDKVTPMMARILVYFAEVSRLGGLVWSGDCGGTLRSCAIGTRDLPQRVSHQRLTGRVSLGMVVMLPGGDSGYSV